MISRMKQPRAAAAWTIAALATALGACSTAGTSNYAATQVIKLGANDRLPAGEPTVAWERPSQSYTFGSAGTHQTWNVDINQVQTWTEQVEYMDTCYSAAQVPVQGTCDVPHCTGGAGQSVLWNAYFSAPRAEKADKLAAAILGVGNDSKNGPGSAQKLVDAGYFASKPRSWEAFTAELSRAADAKVISRNVFSQATVKYAAGNIANLGYGSTNCQMVAEACTQWADQGNIPCVKTHPVDRTRNIDTVSRTVVLDVIGPKLQSFETETLTVTVGHEPYDVQLSDGAFNRYDVTPRVEGNRVYLRAVSRQRIPADLPNSIGSGSFARDNRGNAFFVKVDTHYLGNDRDPLLLKYQVETCQKNRIGFCGSFAGSGWVTVPVTGEYTTALIPINQHQKAKIDWVLVRPNSPWYDAKPTDQQTTGVVSN